MLRADGTKACAGYWLDSLTVGLVAVCRVKFAGETRDGSAAFTPLQRTRERRVGSFKQFFSVNIEAG